MTQKIKTKLHLSKVKQSKFNESGQLLLFYIVAVLWGGDVIFREGLLFNVSALWRDYPNIAMTFMFKFFFIVQMAYWLHCYPELYFQKVKREDMPARITYATIYLVSIAAAYVMNFTRLALCLLVLHYAAETVFHVARLIHFADKPFVAAKGIIQLSFFNVFVISPLFPCSAFSVWNILFVVTRLASIILSVSTFWFGLADNESVTFVVRVSGLAAVVALQVYMLQRFLTFHLSRRRESSRLKSTAEAEAKKAKQDKKAKKAREAAKKSSEENEISELPEVDQNTNKNLRQRGAAKSK
jgi:translocating chain-associated membrane protein 1